MKPSGARLFWADTFSAEKKRMAPKIQIKTFFISHYLQLPLQLAADPDHLAIDMEPVRFDL